MKLAFYGTPKFAVPSLRALHGAGHAVEKHLLDARVVVKILAHPKRGQRASRGNMHRRRAVE